MRAKALGVYTLRKRAPQRAFRVFAPRLAVWMSSLAAAGLFAPHVRADLVVISRTRAEPGMGPEPRADVDVQCEKIRVECYYNDRRGCIREEHYRIWNRTEAAQEVFAAPNAGFALYARVEDENVKTQAWTFDLGRVDLISKASGRPAGAQSLVPVSIPPKASRRVVVGMVERYSGDSSRWRGTDTLNGVRVRHPLLNRHRSPKDYTVVLADAQRKVAEGRPGVPLEVVVPSGYRFWSVPALFPPAGAGVWTAQLPTQGPVPELTLHFQEERFPIIHGGLLVAAGFSELDDRGFRFRAGWEVAGPDWLLYSLAYESDFRSRHVLVPTVLASTGAPCSICFAVGGGFGLPVQMVPEPRLGARAVVDLHFPFVVGFMTAIDWYPKVSATDRPLLQMQLLWQAQL